MLNGYKTYITAAISIIYAASAFATGHMDANQAIQLAQVAFVAAFLRHGQTTGA